MPKLDDLLGIAPTKPARVKLDDLLGTAPAPSVASPPKVKLDDLLGDGPSAPKPNLVDDLFKPPTLTVVDRNVPRPAPIRVDTPKPPAPLPTAGGWVGNMQRRAREAIAGERPFVNPTTGQAAQGEMKGRGVQPEVQMPRPDLEKLEAERKARLLVKANEAAANPNMKFGGVDFAPIAAKELAKQAGVDPEQIAKLGREQYKGGPTVTGFPTPPREIPTTESPDLVRRREQLAARQGNADRTLGQYVTDAVKVASGQPLPARPVPMDRGESGVAPRNSYGTTGSPDIFGLDYNPLGAVVGAADEVYREAKSGVVPLIEGITGQKSGIRTDIGFLPKTEAPSINVGRNLAGAPYAIAENLGGKVAPALNKIQQEGIGAGINEALGKNDRKFGGLGEESTYKGDALDAIADSVINAPGELFGLAMVPVHGAIGAYNLADNLGRGDITPKEVWKAPTDAATGMVGGMVRDVAALAMDPKQKLSEGAFSTLATVAPFTGALRSGLGVDSLYAKSARAAEDANAIRARPDVAALQMEGIDKLKAARGAESAEFKAGNALEDARARLIDAGPNPPKPLFSQLIERNAEHVKAREAAEAARKVLDEFEAEHRPRLDKAFADVAKGYKEASALEAQALGRHIVSRLPSYYATLGVTAVTDALGILAGRAMRGAGKGGWRWVLDRQGDRLPELAGIMREMGREGHSESAILETAYRKLPPELRPEVRKALMMEHTLQEGGFYRPGNDYARHIITNMDGNQWEFTPYGKRWLKEQEDIATTARAEMNAATDDAIAAAARDRMNTALDNIQKAETHVEVANKYGTPFSMSSTRASAAEAELGIIDPSDAAEYEAFRTAQIDKLKAAHDAIVAKADEAFARDTAIAQKLLDLQQKETQLIADSVTRRAGQRNALDKNRAGSAYTEDWKKLSPTNQRGYKGAWNRLGERMGSADAQNRLDLRAINAPVQTVSARQMARAQRVIDRAKKLHEEIVGNSLAKLGAEIYAIEAAPVPNGFRRVQWRQVIDKTARDERIQETRSDAVTVAASSKNTLGPTTQLDQLHRSMMRAEQMPVRRRELQYNLSDNFGQEVQALQQRWNDIATFRLYKELADRYGLTKEQFDAQRAVDVGVSNAMGRRIDPVDALSKATETDKRYIRVPEQAKFDGVEGSPPMYGALSGKYIPEDLWYELVNSQVIKEEMANSLNRGLSMLKVFKTVLSPVTTARNFWTNALLLAPMAGVSLMDPRNWPHFWEGLKEFVSKDKSPFYRAVEERGLFDSGFHRNEMALKVLDDVHSGFVDHVAGPLKGFAEGFAELLGSVKAAASKEERIARKNYQSNMERLRAVQSQGPDAWLAEYGKMRLPTAGKKAKEGLSKITEATRQAFMGNPGAFYAAGDDFFRYVLAKKMAAQGHSINRIIETGRNAFGNYADNPGFVQVVRAPVAPVLSRNMAGGKPQRSTGLRSVFFIGGQPFIAYSAWAIPHVKKWAQQNPWRFMLMDNLHETVSRANLASIGLTEQDERDIISANAISKPWEAGRVLLATIAPRLARDEQGGFRTLDAAYMSPLSNVAPNVDPMASKGGQAMQRATSLLGLNGGMLFQPIMDVVQGRDSFTGREIITDAQRPAETAASVGSYLYRAFMPPWMPSPTDVFGGEVSDLKDPARWTGGSYYEQGAAAVTGQPNYTGQKRTVGEFAFNTASGAKLGSVDMTDTALQGLARLGELFSSADILATASKGQGRDPLDPNMDDDTREALVQDYRDRVQERVQQFRDTITRLGGNVAADNDIITGLADSLGDLQDEEDPWTYYRLSRRIVNRYMGLLRQRAADYREKRAQAMGK